MKKLGVAFSTLTIGLIFFLAGSRVYADTINYNNVIHDSIFDDTTTMNAAQIDAFLNSFPNSCISTNNGFSAPDPTGYSPSTKYTYGANVSAGTVIYDAAQAYGINPQVIIATLQKEQGLVVGDGANIVRNATRPGDCGALAISASVGYNCPDTLVLSNYSGLTLYAYNGVPVTSVSQTCVRNAAYVGFSRQVINAAWLFTFDRHRSEGQSNWYISKPNWDNSDDLGFCYSGPMTQGTFAVCPSGPAAPYDGYYTIDNTVVHMDNGATAALYHYTPHLHGQQLLFDTFTAWFGSTQPGVVTNSSLTVGPDADFFTNMPVTATVSFKNNTSSAIDIGTFTAAVRDQSLNNYDFPQQHVIVPAHGIFTYQQTRTFDQPGTYSVSFGDYRDGIGWTSDYPVSGLSTYARSTTIQIQAQPTVTSSLSGLSPTLRVGQNYTATFSVANHDAGAVALGTMFVAIRDSAGRNWDLPPDNNVIIAAGQVYTFSKTAYFTQPGTYTATLSNWRPGVGWNSTFPASETNAIVRTLDVTVSPSPTVTVGLSSSNTSPHVGQTTTLSFQVENYGSTAIQPGRLGLAVRDPQGHNYDPWWDSPTINAGQTYTYTVSLPFDKAGSWTVEIGNYQTSLGWNNTYPVSENSSIVRRLVIGVNQSVTTTTGIALSANPLRVGQQATATFTITNFGGFPVSIGRIGIAVRDSKGANLDIGYDDITLAAGAVYTYSKNVTFNAAGIMRLTLANYQASVGWNSTFPASETNAIVRTLDVTVSPSPTVTVGLSSSNTSPHVGQTTTLSFQVENYGSTAIQPGRLGLAVRDPQGHNYDPWWDSPTINAGQTYTYTVSLPFDKAGSWTVEIGNYQTSLGWNNTYPVSENSSIVRRLVIGVMN